LKYPITLNIEIQGFLLVSEFQKPWGENYFSCRLGCLEVSKPNVISSLGFNVKD